MSVEIKAGIARRQAALQNTIAEIRGHETSVKRKLLLSAGLGTAVFLVTWGAIPAFAVKESGLVDGLTKGTLKTGLALGLSYGINMVSLFINLNQSRRLLQNKNIETSQNLPATVIYHSLGKVGSLKEQRKKRSIIAISAPTIPSTIYDIARDSSLLFFASLSPEKMHGVVLFKSAQTVFSLVQAGVSEVVLRTKGKDKETKSKLPRSDIIVDMKKNS